MDTGCMVPSIATLANHVADVLAPPGGAPGSTLRPHRSLAPTRRRGRACRHPPRRSPLRRHGHVLHGAADRHAGQPRFGRAGAYGRCTGVGAAAAPQPCPDTETPPSVPPPPTALTVA